jgi:hypothetical protein
MWWMLSFATDGSTWLLPSDAEPWKATVAPLGIGTALLRSEVAGEEQPAIPSRLKAAPKCRIRAASTMNDIGSPPRLVVRVGMYLDPGVCRGDA